MGSDCPARVTRGSAKDQAGKEQFCRPGMHAVFAVEPEAQLSLAMVHRVIMGRKMFRQHHGSICKKYDPT